MTNEQLIELQQASTTLTTLLPFYKSLTANQVKLVVTLMAEPDINMVKLGKDCGFTKSTTTTIVATLLKDVYSEAGCPLNKLLYTVSTAADVKGDKDAIQVLELFVELHDKIYSTPYKINWARDVKLVNTKLLSKYKLNVCLDLVRLYVTEYGTRWANRNYPTPILGGFTSFGHDNCYTLYCLRKMKEREGLAGKQTNTTQFQF